MLFGSCKVLSNACLLRLQFLPRLPVCNCLLMLQFLLSLLVCDCLLMLLLPISFLFPLASALF
ncbi:hypothetical protein [Methanimicrococcus hongohii]|uniref:hypothetical protein n=1 Tax=Methanimicrococcus hongohii TaxID=3028295 RepID=UPI00292E7199|nr:hypothetical protein [Methanimicrococcus sp. Hf6]